MYELDIDPDFAERSVNEGFSGGEKKRHEILQLSLLKPKIAVLDETDSGLDVDALRVVSRGRQPVPGRRGRRRAADHPLHPDPAATSRPTTCTSSRAGASSSPVGRSSPTSWSPRLRAGSPPAGGDGGVVDRGGTTDRRPADGQ